MSYLTARTESLVVHPHVCRLSIVLLARLLISKERQLI